MDAALALSGLISAEHQADLHKLNFMRCARTDKGVHAARQVCGRSTLRF